MSAEEDINPNPFVFRIGPSDEEIAARQLEMRNHMAGVTIDWNRNYSDTLQPAITLSSEVAVPQETTDKILDTTKKVGAVIGLYNQRAPEKNEPILSPKLEIQPQEKVNAEAGENTRAYTQFDKIIIGSDAVNPAEDIKNNSDEYAKILGEAVTPSTENAVILSEYRLQSSVAHELYHLRQRIILPVGKPRSESTTEQRETKKKMDTMYKYRPDERGARAFELRFLVEERKQLDTSSREAVVLDKYIQHKVMTEKGFSAEYKGIMDLDRAIESFEKLLSTPSRPT